MSNKILSFVILLSCAVYIFSGCSSEECYTCTATMTGASPESGSTCEENLTEGEKLAFETAFTATHLGYDISCD